MEENIKYKKGLTSIILPVWLPKGKQVMKGRYIKWTLNSLARTTDKPFELIVYINEYKKEDVEFIEKHTKQFDNNKYCKGVKILKHTKNMGWTGALDDGICNSEGEYVNFTNDDLIFSENWLSKMLKHFVPGVGAVGPVSNYVTGLQVASKLKPKIYEERVNWIIGFSMMVRREALDQIKAQKGEMYYIDPSFYPGGSEEIDVCIRLRKAGYEILIAKDVFIHHFGSKSLNLIQEFQDEDKFFKKRMDILLQKHGVQYKQVIETQKCPTIGIGIPTVGNIDHLFFGSYHWILSKSIEFFGTDSVIPIIAPRNLIHIGRSEIVRQALNFGCEYLFFLDDDMIIPQNTIVRLYKYKKDFVTALAFMRTEPFKPCIYKGKTSDNKWLESYGYKEGLVEIDASGLSCSLINMKVIKTLLQEKGKEIKDRGGLFHINRFGEDMNFCEDLAEIGVKLYCDTNLIIDHLGQKQRVNDITHMSYHRQQEALKEKRLKMGK